MTQLVQGSVGQDVKNLQTALNYHFPKAGPLLAVDGKFGPKTLARVVLAQETYNIPPPRGVVGPRTRRALFTFVNIKHHFVLVKYALRNPFIRTRNAFTSGDDVPSPSLLPELPRLQLPFPEPFKPTPHLVPELTLDLGFLRSIKFELEAGKQTSFSTKLGGPESGKRERAINLLTLDFKATVWTKPIGDVGEVKAGAGVILEKRLQSPEGAQTSAYIFAGVEIGDFSKVGPLTLAKIAADAELKTGPDFKGPPEFSTTVAIGPEVEAAGGRLTLGPSVYSELKIAHEAVEIGAGVKITATWHF